MICPLRRGMAERIRAVALPRQPVQQPLEPANRLVMGTELVAIKDALEDPARLLLDL